MQEKKYVLIISYSHKKRADERSVHPRVRGRRAANLFSLSIFLWLPFSSLTRGSETDMAHPPRNVAVKSPATRPYVLARGGESVLNVSLEAYVCQVCQTSHQSRQRKHLRAVRSDDPIELA